jgi:hypothetical protein
MSKPIISETEQKIVLEELKQIYSVLRFRNIQSQPALQIQTAYFMGLTRALVDKEIPPFWTICIQTGRSVVKEYERVNPTPTQETPNRNIGLNLP